MMPGLFAITTSTVKVSPIAIACSGATREMVGAPAAVAPMMPKGIIVNSNNAANNTDSNFFILYHSLYKVTGATV